MIDQAKRYIHDHYMFQISLKNVAENLHINYSYLSELFKLKTGVNFSDYLVKIRISEAQKMLQDPGARIYEISDAVGYLNSTAFIRAFKKCTGLSPAEYRKRMNI